MYPNIPSDPICKCQDYHAGIVHAPPVQQRAAAHFASLMRFATHSICHHMPHTSDVGHMNLRAHHQSSLQSLYDVVGHFFLPVEAEGQKIQAHGPVLAWNVPSIEMTDCGSRITFASGARYLTAPGTKSLSNKAYQPFKLAQAQLASKLQGHTENMPRGRADYHLLSAGSL